MGFALNLKVMKAMTILKNENKLKRMTSDPVVELMADAMCRDTNKDYGLSNADEFQAQIYRDNAVAILSALSDAGLGVLPLEATDMMHSAGRPYTKMPHTAWFDMAAAFRPSQLEKTDE